MPFAATWRDACGNEEAVQGPVDGIPHGYSAILVDLADPYAPSPAPEVLEVLALGGSDLLVYDGNSGAYTLRFTGIHPDVPPAMPWEDNPWIG